MTRADQLANRADAIDVPVEAARMRRKGEKQARQRGVAEYDPRDRRTPIEQADEAASKLVRRVLTVTFQREINAAVAAAGAWRAERGL